MRRQEPIDPVDLIKEILNKAELIKAKQRKAELEADINRLLLKRDAIEKQRNDWLVGWHLYNVLGAEKHPMFERCCETELMRIINMTPMGETA